MEQPNYHVLLDGRTVGPYDRRTIVGMRIKRTLTSDHLLVTADGTRLTVRELVGGGTARGRGAPGGPATSSRALATYTAILMEAGRRGFAIPRFKGEIEMRVQAEVLRLEGRRRCWFGWKQERIKLPLGGVAQARVTGPRVDLWLAQGGESGPLQRLALHLFTAEAAQEFLGWLPAAASDPERPAAAAARTADGKGPVPAGRALAIAVAALALVIGMVLLVLMSRRVY